MFLSGNWRHVSQRTKERIAPEHHPLVDKAINHGLNKMAKGKGLPNTSWYRAVRERKTTIGYICGQGNWISTIMSTDMVPHGTEV